MSLWVRQIKDPTDLMVGSFPVSYSVQDASYGVLLVLVCLHERPLNLQHLVCKDTSVLAMEYIPLSACMHVFIQDLHSRACTLTHL